ncbi:MAG: hypothetical protein GWN64_07955 [Candidatus Thorarchaeota archaeon]|nr:hypothetical protein [Candidatus Thorarchaeota archaeon]
MITAIITQLKTGSVSNVVAKFDGKVNLVPPYVVVWEDIRSGRLSGVYVAYHNVPGTSDLVDDYMTEEVLTLLDKVILTDASGNKFRLEDTNEVSQLVEDNDDHTISKDRLFLLPKLGAV